MSLHLKLFNTTAEYNTYTADTSNFILPNVSYCKDNDGVHYSPIVPETRIVAKYNVTSTSEPIQIVGVAWGTPYTSGFSAIEIDGVAQPSVVSAYTFSTTGEHTVKYTLTGPTTIGKSAFEECSGLTSIVIPDSVTSIGDYAFYGCSSLTSMVIPNSVTSIGEDAFGDTPWWDTYSADTSHQYGNIIYINDVAYQAVSRTITSATFKSGTVSIGSYAFYDCDGLTSIVIPDSVTSIGGSAFNSCSNLTSCTIGSGVTSIGTSAFQNCGSLTSCTIGSGVTSIGYGTFENCNNLTSIIIPDSVTSIGENAFYGCIRLTSIDIPNGVTTVGENAFKRCKSLTSCTIGSGVTSIGNGAFEECSGLTSIVIPDSVTSIGRSAFFNCESLTSCTIGSGVTSIDDDALRYCDSLTSIISNATTAPTIESSTFQGVKTGGTLTVPSGSSGYNAWMSTGNYYLGKYNWTKVEK